MQASRTCKFVKEGGDRCAAPPRQESDLCFVHDPDYAAEMAEARRLGGLRRRREKTLAGAYDFEGLDSVPKIRRVLDIATLDALGLDNSIARVRALIAAPVAAGKLLEVGEHEERLETIEAALGPRLVTNKSQRGRRGGWRKR